MADDAVETFLRDAEEALAEYERGYADADATVRVLERHVATLRQAVEDDADE